MTNQQIYKLQKIVYIVKVPGMALRGNAGLPTPSLNSEEEKW